MTVSEPMQIVATVPQGENVVGMVVWQERLFVALTCGLYVVDGNRLVPVPFVPLPAEVPA